MEALKGEIRNYMSSPVFSIEADSSIKEAAKRMHDHHSGALFVTKNEDYIGIISETDITYKLVGKGLDPNKTNVSAVMTEPIISMDSNRQIEEAGEFMCKNKIRYLAITEGDKIVGMLCVKDLFAYCAKTFHLVK